MNNLLPTVSIAFISNSYSSDIDRSSAVKTYEEFVQTYEDFFKTIGVTIKTVHANAGNIGGSLSHEYHIPTDIGEDTVMQCNTCNWSVNLEVSGDVRACPQCQSTIERSKSIEVAHTFLLDDKYSKPLRATFLQSNQKPATFLMGCYGRKNF